MKTIIYSTLALVSIGLSTITVPAYADGYSRELLWKCATKNVCPEGVSKRTARNGLDSYDQKGLQQRRNKLNGLQRSGVVDCAYGGDCPENLTPDKAQKIVEEAERGASSKQTLDAARRCYIYGECLGNDVSGDLMRKLPEFEKRRLEDEKKREMIQNKVDFAVDAQKCANGGKCKWPLTRQKAKEYDSLGGLELSLLRCASGYGCPEGINQKQALALTSADAIREQEKSEKAKAVEPKKAENTPVKKESIEPQAVPEKEPVNEVPDRKQVSENEEQLFDDPDFEKLLKERRNRPNNKTKVQVKAANPNIGVVAHVVAAAGPQQTPTYFSPQELLAQRLPWVDGDDDPDETIAQQDPSLEKPGPPRPVVDETVETFSEPQKAPTIFRIERNNQHRDGSDFEQVSVNLIGKSQSDGPVPRVWLEANITSEQVSTEKFGAKTITGGAPKGEVEAMAFLPIDDGGPAINVSLAVVAKLPNRSMHAGVIPYTEDPYANVFLINQMRTILSAQNPGQAQSSAQSIFGLAGLEQPAIGSFADFVEFNFPETSPGKPRGFLVYLSGEADPEIVSKTNKVRGLDRVTVINTKGTQTAKIGVLVEVTWLAQ